MKSKWKQTIAWLLVACLIAGTGAFNGITLLAAEENSGSGSYASSSDSSREEITEDEYENVDEDEWGVISKEDENEVSTGRHGGSSGAKSGEETEEDDDYDDEPEDWDTASPSDVIEIELASSSDLKPYTYEFLTPEGILISIECEDVDWSDDVTVKVEKVTDEDTEIINNLVNGELAESENINNRKARDIYAYDISFWKNDVEFEPEGNIKVTFELPDDMLGTSDAGIIHVDDELTEAKLMDTMEDENTFSCIAEGFSVYGIALLADVVENFIYSVEDLLNVKSDLTATYILMEDLDLSEYEWEPVGDSTKSFKGDFYGYDHTISGLNINKENDRYAGLFGYVTGKVRNLNLEDVNININNLSDSNTLYTGTIAGYLAGSGSIENCYVSNAEINADVETSLYLGGIVGYISNGEVSNCTFHGIVEGVSHTDNPDDFMTTVGGISGYLSSGKIFQCINFGDIICETEYSSAQAGGITGQTHDNIEQCANFGEITSKQYSNINHSLSKTPFSVAGGISGEAQADVNDCYNTGEITADATVRGESALNSHAGGIVGFYGGSMENCYNIGSVAATGKWNGSGVYSNRVYEGGIVGAIINSYEDGTLYYATPVYTEFENCYYYKDSCSKGVAVGEVSSNTGSMDSVIACSLDDMTEQETFAGFDFADVWQMKYDDYLYPVFEWQTEFGEEEEPEGKRKFSLDIDRSSFNNGNDPGDGFAYEINRLVSFDQYKQLMVLANGNKSTQGNILLHMFAIDFTWDFSQSVLYNFEHGFWNGECFGMSSTMALLYNGDISIKELTDDSTILDYISLPKPVEDKKLLHALNYYQLSQYVDNSAILATYSPDDDTDDLRKLKEFLETLVDIVQNENAMILTFLDHAVVITGTYEYDSTNHVYNIQIYDPNATGKNGQCTGFDNMTISDDFSSFNLNTITYTDITKDNCGDIVRLISSEKLANLELLPISYDDTINFSSDANITINNSRGEYLTYDGSKTSKRFSGNMPVNDLEVIVGRTLDGTGGAINKISLDSDGHYVVESNGNFGTIQIGNADYLCAVSGIGIESIEVSLGNEVILNGDDLSFRVFVSADETEDYENMLTSVAGQSTSQVIIKIEDDKLHVESNNGISDITTSLWGFSGEKAHEYSDQLSQFDVVSGEIVTESSTGTTGSTGSRHSSGSGGGGGGSSSSGSSLGTYTSGTWIQNEDGTWSFSSNGVLATGWSYIRNPYADTTLGQSEYDWFHFSDTGIMDVSWFIDADGNMYYLNPATDGTQGRMFTGWQWIPGIDGLYRCYYFETESNGYQGSLYRSTVTPDGYTVDETGAWTVEGIQMIRV